MFLGVMLVENIPWKQHIEKVENILSKNIGLLCKARQLLDNKPLKNIYFSYIHSYLNYTNTALASTNPTKPKKKTLFTKTSRASNIQRLSIMSFTITCKITCLICFLKRKLCQSY